jgi:small conductance mechanosensitive channel
MFLLQINPTNIVTSTTDTLNQIKDKLVTFGTDYGMQVIGAIIILVIGLLFARWIGNVLAGWLEKQQMELPVRTLLVRVVRLIVMAFVLVMVLDKFGVPVVTLIAGMGVAGVGVGLALQGVLKNLFAGLTIIFTKPFRVGEYIEIAGVSGQVHNIELFSTILIHPDMSRVVIPNHDIIGEILHNYGKIRQLELVVGVGYASNLTEVIAIVRGILDANPRVLKTPVAYIGIAALGNSTINVSVKPWTNVPDYFAAQAELYQAIVDQFRARGIEIPFPQHEVRLLNEPK